MATKPFIRVGIGGPVGSGKTTLARVLCERFRDQCDMGGVARDVSQKFLDKGVTATLIGKDAIAAIVNVNNPVTDLSSQQLKGIFTGQIKNWYDGRNT